MAKKPGQPVRRTRVGMRTGLGFRFDGTSISNFVRRSSSCFAARLLEGSIARFSIADEYTALAYVGTITSVPE